MLIFLPVLLKNRITTIPEYYRKRFGPLCGDIYTWVMLLAYVFLFTVTVLYSGTLAFSEITGWNFYFVLWMLVLCVGVYTIRGGMTSVMWTNTIQCVMLVGGGTLLFVLALRHIPGGWSAMVEATPERFHLYQPVDHPKAPFLGILFASVGVFLFYQVGNQYMIQRVLSARSTWDGLIGIVFSGFINFLRPLTTSFLGLVVFYWIHTMKQGEPLENPDTAFPFALKTFAGPWGLRGFILAGFLAAVMSTLSSLVSSTSTIFSLDVYKRKINPAATDLQMVKAGKWAALVALVVSAVLTPAVYYLGGIFTFFQTGVTYLASPFIAVFLMGILWERTNYPAALFGMIGGLIFQVVIAIAAPQLGFNLHWLYLAFIGQMLTMAAVGVVSLMTERQHNSPVGDLVWKPALLIQYEGRERRPWYQQLKLWFAIWTVGWLYIYYRFW
jgi:SSS family solute:Na+ symporter